MESGRVDERVPIATPCLSRKSLLWLAVGPAPRSAGGVAVLLLLVALARSEATQLNSTSQVQADASSPQQQKQQTSPATQKRLAVLPFDYSMVATSSQALFGSDVDVGKGVADLLALELTKSGSYSLVDPKTVDKILAAQNYSRHDRSDRAAAVRIGKILGVDAVVIGNLTEFGKVTRMIGDEWIHNADRKALAEGEARLVNVATDEIVAVAMGRNQSSGKNNSTPAGNNWHEFDNRDVDFGSKDFQQTLIGEAINAAVAQMAAELTADNGRLDEHATTVEGLVTAVNGGEIVVNVGSKAGLKIGDHLAVKRITKEIKDPTTGHVTLKLTINVGVIRLTRADDTSAVGTAVSGSSFQVGDTASATIR